MKPKSLVGVAVVVLVGAVLFSQLNCEAASRESRADQPGIAIASERTSPSLPALPSAAIKVDAGALLPQAEPAHVDWKVKWDGIPLDRAGSSLSGRGQTTAFARALKGAIREDLRRCNDSRPVKVEQIVNVELFVEGTPDGYDVIGAEVATDAGVDQYTRRCMELAFEQHLTTPDAGGAAMMLYRLEFPVMFAGPDESADAQR